MGLGTAQTLDCYWGERWGMMMTAKEWMVGVGCVVGCRHGEDAEVKGWARR